MKAVAHPNHIRVHPVHHCHHCQASLEAVTASGIEKRHVFDLPQPHVEVTEHQAEIKRCPHCSAENRGDFPKAVTQPAQCGPAILPLAVYLNQYQLLPLERVSETFADVFEHQLAEGTIFDAGQAVAEQVAPVNEAMKKHFAKQEAVVHFDETGTHINGKLHFSLGQYCAAHLLCLSPQTGA